MTDRYSDSINTEVRAAHKENRPVELTKRQQKWLGHSSARPPVVAIRSFCLSCMGGSATEVNKCTSAGCALFPYRFGKNPWAGK
jgi:hypothetical protein